MNRKEKHASDKLEEYIKNFELKNKLKIKKSKSRSKSKNSISKQTQIQADPTYKIEKLIDNLSQRVKDYKDEMSLVNLENFTPIAKYGSEVSIGSSELSSLTKSTYSSSNRINQCTDDDPYLKSLTKFQELNKKLMMDRTKSSDILNSNESKIGYTNEQESKQGIEKFIQDCMKVTHEIPFLKINS
ncbi:hypothetical protein BpHYR1_044196 [Brachionus plicatilis]|uniref:Uncharacterized protein n=1 Tax=Brachionus plicatilis TaxID=10195 RepID=A0A3M7PBQ6_BRAPC|nr:hypothetical protein BpHYR1_044196 [Brachionus plicatilis]